MSNMNDMGSLRTPICDLLGCRYPVIQTAMGYVAGADLVIGTTNAGGFGFLAGATIPPTGSKPKFVSSARPTISLSG
jgi:nitronate monooxygenase